jgi:hypothetical protein
MSTSSSFSV